MKLGEISPGDPMKMLPGGRLLLSLIRNQTRFKLIVVINYLFIIIDNSLFTILYKKFLKATENLLANLDVSAPQIYEEEKRNLDQHHRELQMTADGLNERIQRPILFEQKYDDNVDDDCYVEGDCDVDNGNGYDGDGDEFINTL